MPKFKNAKQAKSWCKAYRARWHKSFTKPIRIRGRKSACTCKSIVKMRAK